MLCKWNVIRNRNSVVGPPNIARVAESTGQGVNLRHRGSEWEICEINVARKYLVVLSLEVYEVTRSWIRSREMVKGTEESMGRYCRELFQPLNDPHFAIADTDAPDEYVETIHNEGGVKVGEVWHRCQVFEGQEMNGFV